MKREIKVLIVDDEPNILLSLEFLMRKEGYTVFIARDGEEAFDIIDKAQPNVLILDIMMPKVDGYQVYKYVKETQLYDTKVMFLSAKSKEADIEFGLGLGADLYMSKPFSTKELIKNVHKLVDEFMELNH